jgi:hypothetical protein
VPRATFLTDYWEAVRLGDPTAIQVFCLASGGDDAMEVVRRIASRARRDYEGLRQRLWRREGADGH